MTTPVKGSEPAQQSPSSFQRLFLIYRYVIESLVTELRFRCYCLIAGIALSAYIFYVRIIFGACYVGGRRALSSF